MLASPASPLVGRRAEIDVFDTTLAALAQGEPRALQVMGPAGIGKSRLLAELAARAEARGHVVLTGAGAELEQDLPFWVFVDALDDYVESLEPRRMERLDGTVRSELAQVLPSLATATVEPGASVHERYRIHRAMRELLEQLAATKPLVVVLDDFHWADAASIDLLVALLHRPPAAGVLLAIAARPRQLAPRLATALERARRAGVVAALELEPLSAEEARALVGARADQWYADSGGNPFYLEQLARAPEAAAGADLALTGVQVPPMVVAALADELALLEPSVRRVLDGAAVAGDPFELDLAAIAADVPEPAVLEAIDELARLDFVRATELPRRFRFRHPIVRHALYETTPGGWRIGAHARLADALAERGAPATARAHHVERSGRHGDLAAVAALREAGYETRHRAPVTAARWFSAALRLLSAAAPVEERVALLLPMAQAQAATGAFAASHATLLEILDVLPRDAVAQWVEVSTWCARVEHLLGRHEAAHDRLLGALAAVPQEDSDEGVAVLVELTLDGLHRMDYQAMRGWAHRAIAAADGCGDRVLQAAGLSAAARGLAFAGASAEAAPICDRAAAVVDELPDGELARRLDAIIDVAGGELYTHRFEDALRHAERGLAIGRATGQHQLFPVAFAIVGMTSMFLGRLHEALDPLEGNVEAARLSGNAQTIAWSLQGLANVAIAAGDLERALAAAQEAVDLGDDGKPSHHVAYAALALAETQLQMGKPERSVALIEGAAGGLDLPLVAESWRAYYLELLVRCQLALGDRDAAARAAGLAGESAEVVGLPLARSWADRATAAVALHDGDAERAATLARRSADVAEAAGGPIEAARSRTLAGRALAHFGDRDGALKELQGAAGLLDAVGAERYRDAAERELRQLGHRVQRRRQPAAASDGEGVETLTQRELEIARLIVDRLTNRQIAEELFLSPKTVETHIRNIFTKLGADSRVEVAHIVERADRRRGSPS